MAEPGRKDEQSRNYEASISSDTERRDAEQSRSTGEGGRRRRRMRSDGNFMQIISILITILTCYICMFEWGSFRGNPSSFVAWSLNCTTWQILRGCFSFSFSLHPWLGEGAGSLNSNDAPSSPSLDKVSKYMQCMCNSTHQIKLWVEVCDCTAVKMSSIKWIILIKWLLTWSSLPGLQLNFLLLKSEGCSRPGILLSLLYRIV